MATNYINIPKAMSRELLTSYKYHFGIHNNSSSTVSFKTARFRRRCKTIQCCTSTSTEEELDGNRRDQEGQFGYFTKEFGWNVRRLEEMEREIRRVAYIQSEAFYEPMRFFNDFFFEIFQAEVLAGLLYRLRNSPPDRYACLVAVPNTETTESAYSDLVGVVDVTVLRDNDIVRHLPGAREYLYVSGIAVLKDFRRRKVASALLKACDILSDDWGFECLVLRAYEDDMGALKLYGNAGYRIVTGDPPWMSTWIGRRRRVIMIKQHNYFGKSDI